MPSARGWLHAKRQLFLGLFLSFVLYALAGFLLVPHLIQTRALPLLSQELGGQWNVTHAEFNPFCLKFSLHGFTLRNPAGHELISIDSLEADLDAAESLRRGLLVVSAAVHNPKVILELDKNGRHGFSFLIPERKTPSANTAAFPFRLTRLTIEQGKLGIADFSRPEAFKTELSPLAFSVENLSTIAGEPARFSLEAQGPHREEIHAQGTFALLSNAAEADVVVQDFPLASLATFFPEPYRVNDGLLSLKLHYKAGEGAEIKAGEASIRHFLLAVGERPLLAAESLSAHEISLHMKKEKMKLGKLAIRGTELRTPSVSGPSAENRITSLDIFGIELDLKSKSVAVERVESESARLSAWISPEGALRLPGLPAEETATMPTGAEPAPSAWHARVSSVEVHDYKTRFTDLSVTPPLELDLSPINLTIKDFGTDADTEIKLKLETSVGKKGHATAEGKIILHPHLIADLRIAIDDLGIRRFQPYLEKFAGIQVYKGRLNLAGDFDFFAGPQNSVRFSGDAVLNGLAATGKHSGKELFNWQELKLNGLIFETIPQRLSIREVIATEPYANLVIDRNGVLNIAAAFAPPSPPQPAQTGDAKPREALPVVIGALRITKGHANFADLTLKPANFAIGIHELHGNIRGLSSLADAKADVLLEGKIDYDSPARISGQINPFSLNTFTDIDMQFRGVDLTTLSPYSGKFAGYRIQKGKVSMNLRYRLNDGRLVADNRLMFDQLTLGERVESPEATSLPVDLAIALLKDGSGHFDLDLPISGDLKDPRVSIGGLFSAAAQQFLAKLVSAPFSLLGSIVADDGQDLGSVSFEPGSNRLRAKEKNKLLKVSNALKARPGLNLEIKGEVNPRQDRLALAEQELIRQLETNRRMELRGRSNLPANGDRTQLADDDYRRLLIDYLQRQGPHRLRALGAGMGTLEGKRLDEAKRKLLESWPVDELDLRRLAQARSQAVREFFVKEAGMPEERIYLLDVGFASPEEQQIKASLALSGS